MSMSAIRSSHVSSGKSGSAATCWKPALFTRMSSAPRPSTVSTTALRHPLVAHEVCPHEHPIDLTCHFTPANLINVHNSDLVALLEQG